MWLKYAGEWGTGACADAFNDKNGNTARRRRSVELAEKILR
jgi:hypothetical protein